MVDIGSTTRGVRLRRLWERLPSTARRIIMRAVSHDQIRGLILDKLGVRPRSGFLTISEGVAAISNAMEHVSKMGLTGDYYEFGLYRGYTFWTAQQAADQLNMTDMRFFGFDSFSGLPDVEGADRDAGIFISGDYSCSKEEVTKYLSENGFDWTRGCLVEGFFDESLTEKLKQDLGLGPAAVVMIDCDLYQSAVPVLTFVEDLLQDGTVLLFDDWHCFGDDPQRGEIRAFSEFLERRPDWRAEHLADYGAYGRVFAMHRGVPEALTANE